MQQHNNGASKFNQQPKDTLKHNAAITSIQAFADYTASGKRDSEKIKALATIANNQPVTSRRLSELMQVERCHITRCIKDLEQAGRIRVSHIGKCRVTGKRVQHYCLMDWQPSLFPNP